MEIKDYEIKSKELEDKIKDFINECCNAGSKDVLFFTEDLIVNFNIIDVAFNQWGENCDCLLHFSRIEDDKKIYLCMYKFPFKNIDILEFNKKCAKIEYFKNRG